MFRFVGISVRGGGAGGQSSDMFQAIDLTSVADLVASGNATAIVRWFANRVAGDDQTDTGLGTGIGALTGPVSEFPSKAFGTDQYLSTTGQAISLDGDPTCTILADL